MELKFWEVEEVVAVVLWRSTEVDAEGEDWPLDDGGGSSRTRDSMSSWDACKFAPSSPWFSCFIIF